MSEDRQRIVLQLDVHRVPLTVVREKEPIYREGAKLLNDRYKYFLHKFPNASAEELWVYVALEQAVNLQNDARDKNLEPLDMKIQELNRKIEQSLSPDGQ